MSNGNILLCMHFIALARWLGKMTIWLHEKKEGKHKTKIINGIEEFICAFDEYVDCSSALLLNKKAKLKRDYWLNGNRWKQIPKWKFSDWVASDWPKVTILNKIWDCIQPTSAIVALIVKNFEISRLAERIAKRNCLCTKLFKSNQLSPF